MEVIAAIDMCVVPTLTFERLFAFLVLSHGRRQLLWFEVTRHPTAEWLARQITEAFPWTSAPTYLVRDNDAAYGHVFTSRLRAMGIRDRPMPHLTAADIAEACQVHAEESKLDAAVLNAQAQASKRIAEIILETNEPNLEGALKVLAARSARAMAAPLKC